MELNIEYRDSGGSVYIVSSDIPLELSKYIDKEQIEYDAFTLLVNTFDLVIVMEQLECKLLDIIIEEQLELEAFDIFGWHYEAEDLVESYSSIVKI